MLRGNKQKEQKMLSFKIIDDRTVEVVELQLGKGKVVEKPIGCLNLTGKLDTSKLFEVDSKLDKADCNHLLKGLNDGALLCFGVHI